ncbi:permease prefix domain 1-containing protein [Priestia megaterium]|jgi:cytochrome c-type biogenesis protein CcmH/NrfF|uniref:permease prefix domain 1-containing protein n=2 Tax=Priestia megaterium TaxID=1404 RepID=UPI0021BE5A2A|nr:permease prefix domain 1-containing protein [Priestia megaterium]MCT9852420.1 permease prefix domain 1-containing protein [Priestia megaterium]
MKKINQFVDSIYSDVSGKEAEEMKEEMRTHLIETVEDLKLEGKSEKEAIEIALNRFGDEKQITKGLFSLFKEQSTIVKKLFRCSVVLLIVGFIFLVALITRDQMIASKNDKAVSTIQNLIDNLGDEPLSQNEKERIVNTTVKGLKIEDFALYKKPEGSPKKFKDSQFPEVYSKMNQVIEYGDEKEWDAGIENPNWYAEFTYKQIPFYEPFYAIPYSLFIVALVLGIVALFIKQRSTKNKLHILLQ